MAIKLQTVAERVDSHSVAIESLGLGTYGKSEDWRGISYVDPDAVGANPTAKIYPNGTIVGSTDNGSYKKFPDGTAKLFLKSGVLTTSITSGSVFVSSASTLDFPLLLISSVYDVTTSSEEDSQQTWAGRWGTPTVSSIIVRAMGVIASGAMIYNATIEGDWK
jgi:hypothetical protein